MYSNNRITTYLITIYLLVFSLITHVFGITIEEAIVIRVIDGDTIEVVYHDSNNIVRLADINTPERGEEGYNEARNYLTTLLLDKIVSMDCDDKLDKYNRYACVVYLKYNSTHQLNVNYLLVKEGYAKIKDFKNKFNPEEWRLYMENRAIPEFPMYIPLAIALIIMLVTYVIFTKLPSLRRL